MSEEQIPYGTPRKVGVDPQVHAIAAGFVDDLVQTMNRPILPSVRAALTDRAAEAMQQAVEQELEAIREELAS